MITFKNTIHSTKNIMAILFNSDISIQMGGFAIWYRAGKLLVWILFYLKAEIKIKKIIL